VSGCEPAAADREWWERPSIDSNAVCDSGADSQWLGQQHQLVGWSMVCSVHYLVMKVRKGGGADLVSLSHSLQQYTNLLTLT